MKPRPLSVLVALAFTASLPALAAPPLPQNGQFVDGTGSIARNGANLDITQSSNRCIIDWTGFSIGPGRTVSFSNGSGSTLNRVTGSAMSQLNGHLNATGSVYLINPNGVLVGPSGVISTGGRFVASTLDADNTTFMQGGPLVLSGASNGVVVNLGHISSSGGDVFLVANKSVANVGTIDAPTGTAELATGSQVLLSDSSSGQQVFVLAGNGGQTLNAGTIRAAQIDLQATDGNVYALAGNHSVLRATGTATRDGHVWLVADGGTVNAQGATIDAHNADGSGGTVDTQGDTLNVQNATVTAGQWNLTAPTFTIDAPTAAALTNSLSAGTSVAVNTTGANGSTGDIGVQSNLSWNGASSLALNAYHSITVAPNTTIANTGAGNLTLRADATSLDNAGSVTNNGTLDWSGSTGIVSALYDMNGSYTPGTINTNSSWSAAPFSGLVTQVTAYQLVNSIADLNAINNNLAGNYALGTDLDASDTPNAVPVIGGPSNLAFTGQFDGMGHTIANLLMSANDTTNLSANSGLFALIGTAGVVRNLTLANAIASAANTGPVGALAGENDGTITHVNASGTVTGDFGIDVGHGGLVGNNTGTIEQSSADVTMYGLGHEGGLVGDNSGQILQSFASGTINGGTHATTGGLAAYNTGLIEQSYSAGTINGGGPFAGLVAFNYGSIVQSFTSSPLNVNPYTPSTPGGIADSNTGTITDSYWNSSVSAATTGVVQGNPVPAIAALTTAQMSDPASFGATWDFSPTGAWAMPAGATHPVLRWQTEP
ncbi:beta strand repeat-containing protein [Paraburkholderia phosphatilytica]|uniref:beta strand repeat-containing protein n=1 Tax=Paraburkholderia phosphatilytica TaxID=2282883 RepID=UPI001F0BBF8B|nr:filamentous hemagglutinin N-terminal domain-containing protein [Paraburkholderia phosphatilytica]